MQGLRPRLHALLVFAVALVSQAAASTADAQEVLGPPHDARTPARGEVRITVNTSLVRYTDVFGALAGSPAAEHAPLLAGISGDNVGVAALRSLPPIQEAIRRASDNSAFTLSIGRVDAFAERSSVVVPIGISAGITDRISVGMLVPIVRHRREMNVRINPFGPGGNVGLNPAFGAGVARTIAIAANSDLRDELTDAAARLEIALSTCAATPTAPGCDAVNANRPAAAALVTTTRALRGDLEALYGSDTTAAAAALIPLAGSAAQTAIDGRLLAMNANYRTYLGLGSGDADLISARPFAAQTPLTTANARDLLVGPALRVNGDTLFSAVRAGIGDIELSGTVKVIDFDPDSFVVGLRGAVSAVLRLGTSTAEFEDDLIETPRLSGQRDLEFRFASELTVGEHFGAILSASYTQQMSHEPTVRIRGVGELFPPDFTSQRVERDPGDYVTLEASPRFSIGQMLSLTGYYSVRHKSTDLYVGTFTGPDGESIDARELGLGTKETEQRLGFGLTFSPSQVRGRDGRHFPADISYAHIRTVAGEGRGLPHARIDQVRVRVFWRAFR